MTTNSGQRNPRQTTCSKDPESTLVADAEERISAISKQTQIFTATAVHDLEGHLQGIASGIFLLRRYYGDILDAKGEQILVGMSRGVAQMKGLVDDILVFSKANEQRHRLDLVDLNEVAQSVVADLQSDIETNHAKISIEELPVVCGDKAQLYRVFQNLLNNALKYRKPQCDPAITIRSHLISSREGSLTDYSHDISIEDNGIGFSDEQAGSIFESFHRLDNPGTEGSGLGLAICQRIVAGHRGSIRAEGVPGVGARFIVRLPCIKCCEKSDLCPLAAASYDRKCPALKHRNTELVSALAGNFILSGAFL